MKQLFFDTETTGLNARQDRIVSFGWIVRTVSDGGRYKAEHSQGQWLFDPHREIAPEAVSVHGYTRAKLLSLGAGDITGKLDNIVALFEECDQAIAHNASFDINMVNGELQRAGYQQLLGGEKVVDTIEVARARLPRLTSYSLDALVQHFNLPSRSSREHDALEDCSILAQVYDELSVAGDKSSLLPEEQQVVVPQTDKIVKVVLSPKAKKQFADYAARYKLWMLSDQPLATGEEQQAKKSAK